MPCPFPGTPHGRSCDALPAPCSCELKFTVTEGEVVAVRTVEEIGSRGWFIYEEVEQALLHPSWCAGEVVSADEVQVQR